MTYPVMLDGSRFSALVVGGGDVAARKARNLLEGGVRVTVVAPEICAELVALAAQDARLTLHARGYAPGDADAAAIVVAATNHSALNRTVAADAAARGRLVNVADDPAAGNFVTPSVHRSGELTVAISTGRTPAAAAAIRADVGRRFDGRYAQAIGALRALRDRLLGEGRREEWQRASRELIADDFCSRVERGELEARIASWR